MLISSIVSTIYYARDKHAEPYIGFHMLILRKVGYRFHFLIFS